jgi:hypothetical protein
MALCIAESCGTALCITESCGMALCIAEKYPYPANTKPQELCMKDAMPILHSGHNTKCAYVNGTPAYRNFT